MPNGSWPAPNPVQSAVVADELVGRVVCPQGPSGAGCLCRAAAGVASAGGSVKHSTPLLGAATTAVGPLRGRGRAICRRRTSQAGQALHEPKILMSNDRTLTARDLVLMYTLRWQIELFFKELKSTLGMHRYRFRDFERVELAGRGGGDVSVPGVVSGPAVATAGSGRAASTMVANAAVPGGVPGAAAACRGTRELLWMGPRVGDGRGATQAESLAPRRPAQARPGGHLRSRNLAECETRKLASRACGDAAEFDCKQPVFGGIALATSELPLELLEQPELHRRGPRARR